MKICQILILKRYIYIVANSSSLYEQSTYLKKIMYLDSEVIDGVIYVVKIESKRIISFSLQKSSTGINRWELWLPKTKTNNIGDSIENNTYLWMCSINCKKIGPVVHPLWAAQMLLVEPWLIKCRLKLIRGKVKNGREKLLFARARARALTVFQ